MNRTATDFGGHLTANSKVEVFPRVADNLGYRFQMQSIQCNKRLDVVSVFVFFWGRTRHNIFMSDGGNNIIKTL